MPRDPLTGVYNKGFFLDCIKNEFAHHERHRVDLSVVMLDIEHFKRINDTYGHVVGDQVLKTIAQILEDSLRTEDVFARYGGEEFAVLLRGITLIGAIRAAERLRAAISSQIFVGTPRLAVSVSIGCAALSCLEELSAGALVHVADQRLYEAKQSGRGRVVAEGYQAQG